jgi:photosystem II stability/assembly factor-like uncharacterized protein
MAELWRMGSLRRPGIPVATLLVSVVLSGCLGWYTQLSTTDGSSLSGVSCPTTSDCFAVGANASGSAIVEQTTDGGGNWVPDTDGVTGLGLNAISCPDSEHCVAVGGVSLGGIISPSNAVLVTTDGGATWQASSVTSVDGYLTSVSCPDAEHCWATAAVGIVGTSTVIVTADGGMSWTTLSWSAPPPAGNQSGLMSSQLDAVTCPTTSECLAVGEATYETMLTPPIADQGVISTTDDGGQTWQSQLVSANDVTGISCPNVQYCVAVAQSSAYQVVSTDGGATWTVSILASGAQIAGGNLPAINAISCSDALHCIAVGDCLPNENVAYETPILATSDGGATWSSQATNTIDADLQSVACASASSCWAVGFTSNGVVILHTLDAGTAWPSVASVSPSEGPGGGGAQVTITGAGFEFGVPSVHFGSALATDVTAVSSSEVTVMVPPSADAVPAPGLTVDVTVTNPLGTSPLNSGDEFTYQSLGSDNGAERTAPAVGNLILYWLRSTGQ